MTDQSNPAGQSNPHGNREKYNELGKGGHILK